MYWRIGCVEQLALNLQVDSSEKARRRPRSVTFSGAPPTTTDNTSSLQQPANDSIVRWADSPCGRYLAGITAQGIYVWKLRPFVLLSCLVYETNEFGPLVDIIWAPAVDSLRLFAVLGYGHIYEIAVQILDQPILEYVFTTQHYYARGPGEEEGILGARLEQRRTYRLPNTDSPVVCAAAGQHNAVVVTRTHVYRLTWNGALQSSIAVADIHGDGSVPVSQVIVMGDQDDSQELFVFDDRAVFVVQQNKIYALGVTETTAAAYSAASDMVAVGSVTGTVRLFARTGTDLQRVDNAGSAQGRAARVVGLRWASNGLAVACAYATGHVVVQSALGYELNSTHVGFGLDSAHLAWTDLWLTVCSKQHAAALAFAQAVGDGRSVCLFSDDKVFTHAPDASERWRVEHAPISYLSSYGPIRLAAAEGNNTVIAIAGTRGLAVGGNGKRWQQLRTIQERAIECTALAWSGRYLAAGCIDHGHDGAAQLAFWGRGQTLDTPAATVTLDAPVQALGAYGTVVVAVSRKGLLYEFGLLETGSTLQVAQRRTTNIRALVDVHRIRAVQWVPGAAAERAAYLVLQGTRLRLVTDGQAADVGRAELSMTSAVNVGGMHSLVWWFDGSQLVAAPLNLDDFMAGGARALAERRPRVRVVPAFFPLAVTADGVAAGIDQDTVAFAAAGLAQMPVRVALWLPAALAHMLQTAESDALLYAACFEHRPFFTHAMEMLLLEALEHTQPELLARAVRLLANFAVFDDAIVHCARKTEAAFWPRLFASVGGAARVFRRCLHAGRLHTAAQCLLVLQTLEPPAVAERCVLALLAHAARAQSRQLCTDVLKFLKLAAESDAGMRSLYTRLAAAS
ncbi:WD40 repeat protein [Coemansia brasiliensis]|uniref:WD40 repeat protein n=1 Tax=Coemansia brasiliensis TaxID=2650707 RepID=A0A9W8IH33_9FUNG|nr:WD40 repeat protein [Coemansia brasiliensis]